MSINNQIKQRVAQMYTKTLGPGGLTETMTFMYYVSAATSFDVENDMHEPTWQTVAGVQAVVAQPTDDDMKKSDVVVSDAKLVIPGVFLPREPNVETDRVIRADGTEWNIRKVKGVPGGSLWIVFIYET